MTTTTLERELTPMSYSKINCWQMCPRQYRYRYVESAREEITPLPLIFGSAIHEALEEFMKSLGGDAVLNEAEVQGIFAARMKEEVCLAEALDTPIDWGKADIESTIDMGDAMLAVFLAQVERTSKVVGTEVGFDITLPSGHQMRGFIDLILDDGDGNFRVIDFKTAAKAYGPDKIDHDFQPTIYLEAARQMLGDDAKLNFEYWILSKTKTPKFTIVPVHRTARDWREVQETIGETQAGIHAEAFYRRRGWQCNGCQYAKRCNA